MTIIIGTRLLSQVQRLRFKDIKNLLMVTNRVLDQGFNPNISLAYDSVTIMYSLPNNVRYADTSEAIGETAYFDSDVFKSQIALLFSVVRT